MSEAKNAVDQPRIEAAVREILLAIGEDPDRDGLQQTPARVARAYAEFFSGLHQDAGEILGTTFDIAHSEMVLVKDIPFYSTCEHHLVPFHGVAHVGYIPGPDGKVTGLSKLPAAQEFIRLHGCPGYLRQAECLLYHKRQAALRKACQDAL
mgnify:CR=1 FL=1